jgi:hypothetical protein
MVFALIFIPDTNTSEGLANQVIVLLPLWDTRRQ